MTDNPIENSPEINSTPDGNPKNSLKKTLLLLIKIGITVFLFYFIATKIQLTEIRAEFSEINWNAFGIGLAMTIPNILIQHYKWRYLTHILNPAISNRDIFASLMCGFSIGLVTPGRLGELGKGLFLTSVRRSEITGMSIIDKVFSQLALSVFGLIGMVMMIEFQFQPGTEIKTLVIIFGVLLITILSMVAFVPERVRDVIRSSKKIFHYAPFRDKIFSLISASENFKKHHFAPSLAYALIFQLIIYVQFYWFINAFTPMPISDGLIGASSVMFAKSLLPIALMDIGVREGASIYFLGKLGISASAAFNASIMIFLSNVLLPGVIGLFYLVHFNFFKRHDSRV
ncbi:flippase-like domain-containing protein [bacterium]|nr:flippase-like domain-containing protein [bacterium]